MNIDRKHNLVKRLLETNFDFNDVAAEMAEEIVHANSIHLSNNAVGNIILELQHIDELNLPITPEMATTVAEAIANSVFASTVHMALELKLRGMIDG